MSASPVQQTLNALETLAFILPGPWGPVASAGIHLFGTLFNPDQKDDPAKPILDAIKNGLSDLQKNTTLNNIKEAQNYLSTLDNWVGKTSNRPDLESVSTLTTLIKAMADLDDPITDLDKVINKLDVDVATNLSQYLNLSQTKISTLVSLRVSMVSLLNFRVLLQQRLVNALKDSNLPNDQARVIDELRFLATYFVSLQTYGIQALTDPAAVNKLKTACDDVRDQAIQNVQDVQAEGSAPTEFTPNDAVSYYFVDDTGTKHSETNAYDSDTVSTYVNGGFAVTTNYYLRPPDKRPAATSARNSYIADLSTRCDTFRDQQASIFETAQTLAAGTTGSPTVSVKGPDVDYTVDTKWTGAWKHTKKYVSYAVVFVGPEGWVPDFSRAIYSDWIECKLGSSYCPVISLPTDPYAKGRIVLRSVADDSHGNNAQTTVLSVDNATQTEFTDLDPDNQDDVCPNVFVPPVYWAANYLYTQAGRTWPDPYRVRYRYRWQKTIGGKVCSSVQWSPWGLPRAFGGQDIDSKGFLYNPSYYSFQLLVPDPYDAKSSFVLQRHFANQPVPDDDNPGIRCRVSNAKRGGMLFLSDNEGP